jgi:hypothetical protein
MSNEAIFAAAHRLCLHLNYPSWLTSIGVGAGEIIIFTRIPVERCPRDKVGDVWEGYPVAWRFLGEFAPLGGQA